MNINYILNKGTISTTLSLLKLDNNESSNSIDASYDLKNNNNIKNNICNNQYNSNNNNSTNNFQFNKKYNHNHNCNQFNNILSNNHDGSDPIGFILNESIMEKNERQKLFLKKTKIFNFDRVDQFFHQYTHLTFGEKIFTLSGYQLCQPNHQNKPYFNLNQNIDMQEVIRSMIGYSGFVYYRMFDLKEASIDLGLANYNCFIIFKEIIDILETLSVINHYKGTLIYKWNGGSFVNKILENLIEKRLIFEPNEKSKEINNILLSFILNKKVIKNFNSFREKTIWDVLVATNIIKIVNNGNDFIINDSNSLY